MTRADAVIARQVSGEWVTARRDEVEAPGTSLRSGFAVQPCAGGAAVHCPPCHSRRNEGTTMIGRAATFGALTVIYLAVQLAVLYLIVGAAAGGLFAYP